MVRKELADGTNGSGTFRFDGDISYADTNGDGINDFSLTAAAGTPGSTSFIRGAVGPADPPWQFVETPTPGWNPPPFAAGDGSDATNGLTVSREDSARGGAQAVITDDTVLDVAVVVPRGSTLSGVLGAAIGVEAGGSNSTAWGVAGGLLAQSANSASRGSYPTIVLALTPTKLHVLGRPPPAWSADGNTSTRSLTSTARTSP